MTNIMKHRANNELQHTPGKNSIQIKIQVTSVVVDG